MAEEAVYSLWAIPPADVTQRLKQMVSSQSLHAEFGSPVFEPHITVSGATRLTREDAIRRLCSACDAGGLRTYTDCVSTVDRGGFFYQCVYLLVEPTPEVMTASALCHERFEYKNATRELSYECGVFQFVCPHLSLLYGGS